jgi:3-hydroxybutyryl-CoA dehydrogenase
MTDTTNTTTIGVIGGGRMGAAIAQIFAADGFDVLLVEPSEAVRSAVIGRIREISRAREQDESIANRIELLPKITNQLASCSIVTEAAPEKLELKQQIFQQLDAICPPATILATNTSVIPVTDIGALTRHCQRVLGTHYWNPPYAVRLVEVVQTAHTSLEVIEKTISLMKVVGQLPVHVKRDVPGFIGNRLQHALKREAIALVENGVCDAETVDFVIRNSFGARLGIMGTLEQSDLVGLNLTLDIHKVILADLDRSTAPQKLLVDLVAAGKTGASVGEGFRTWTPEQRLELQGRLDKALLGGKSKTTDDRTS